MPALKVPSLLQATISKDGRISDLKVISGPKELAPAAVGAVQQWRYRPYFLMGEPVEVLTTVQVNFRLRSVRLARRHTG